MIETSLYQLRFSLEELRAARAFWKPICRFLQQWVRADGTTLDLGAGYCHFINEIRSREKIAVDINEGSLRAHASNGVRLIVSPGSDLSAIGSESVDTVFASNVYEHFPSREDVAASFQEVRRILRPGGYFIVLQPNFAAVYRSYFDFFDHRLSFTHKGMLEGLQMADFKPVRVIPRFLPYTSKSRLPTKPWLVEIYLRFPPAWRLLGGQMLLVVLKPLDK